MSDAGARLAELSGAVLLGGASERMGRDKAQLPVDGVPAATRAARLLEAICSEVLLVGGEPPPDAPGRRIADPPGPRCALRGLVGALEAARGERVLVIATDLPRLTPDLVLALFAWPDADVVAPRRAGRAEPLCALYRREPALARAREHLAAGRLALHGLLEALEVAWIEADDLALADPEGDALSNANTPEEWQQLAARHSS